MIKRMLVIGVFFLLVVSSIGSLSLGYKLSEKIMITENCDRYYVKEILGYGPISSYEQDSFDVAVSGKTNIVKEPFNRLNTPYESDGVYSNQVYTFDEPPGVSWSKTYGGVNAEYAQSVEQTVDGGYILGGHTNSYGAGDWEGWLIKTDIEGNELWNKTYGGALEDIFNCAIQTSDGGYAAAGYAGCSTSGKFELWIIKTDENGTVIWDKKYGNGDKVFGNCIIETEQGYVLVSWANISYPSGGDAWLVELDKNGDMIWNSTFGGTKSDHGDTVIHDDINGGYVIVGTTYSFGYGSSDLWLLKTDENGEELWNKTFGGVEYDTGGDVIQTLDGGFTLTGGITPYGSAWRDACLIRTDENGNELWTRLYGGDDYDLGSSIIQTIDGDFLIAGSTPSFGANSCDGWLIKADENGIELWNVTFGGKDIDSALSVIQSDDGGFVVAGKYGSKNNYDEAWLVKIGYVPTVTIKKPKNGLYFMNSFIRPYLFRNPLIIGPIDIEADVVDHKYEIEKVEFYVNDKLMTTEISEPYSMNWNETVFGRFDVKIVAYNSHGLTGYNTIRVWKFF
jgi:hypothetical protein